MKKKWDKKCGRGHSGHWYKRPDGQRECLICRKTRSKKYDRERQTALLIEMKTNNAFTRNEILRARGYDV